MGKEATRSPGHLMGQDPRLSICDSRLLEVTQYKVHKDKSKTTSDTQVCLWSLQSRLPSLPLICSGQHGRPPCIRGSAPPGDDTPRRSVPECPGAQGWRLCLQRSRYREVRRTRRKPPGV